MSSHVRPEVLSVVFMKDCFPLNMNQKSLKFQINLLSQMYICMMLAAVERSETSVYFFYDTTHYHTLRITNFYGQLWNKMTFILPREWTSFLVLSTAVCQLHYMCLSIIWYYPSTSKNQQNCQRHLRPTGQNLSQICLSLEYKASRPLTSNISQLCRK